VSGVQLPVQENLLQVGISWISRSTQPGHPTMGRRSEYQSNGGDALQLGSKGRYSPRVGGRYNCVISLLSQAISEHFNKGFIP